MFHRSARAKVRVVADAHAELAALTTLAALLRQVLNRRFCIACPAFRRIESLSQESERAPCHAGQSRCGRDAACHNKSTYSQGNRG